MNITIRFNNIDLINSFLNSSFQQSPLCHFGNINTSSALYNSFNVKLFSWSSKLLEIIIFFIESLVMPLKMSVLVGWVISFLFLTIQTLEAVASVILPFSIKIAS